MLESRREDLGLREERGEREGRTRGERGKSEGRAREEWERNKSREKKKQKMSIKKRVNVK